MSLILVIGGYGGFGGEAVPAVVGGRPRASRRRPEPSEAARPLAQGWPEARPGRRWTATATSGRARRASAPDLRDRRRRAVPGQRLPACPQRLHRAPAIPYLDLADATRLRRRHRSARRQARAAGVAVVAGASSVPASDRRGRPPAWPTGWSASSSVDIALSAANRATGGGARWRRRSSPTSAGRCGFGAAAAGRRAWGWQEMRREDFRARRRRAALRGRLVAIADVPDCEAASRPASRPARGDLPRRHRARLPHARSVAGELAGALGLAEIAERGRAGWLLPLYRADRPDRRRRVRR